ncbi:uncharacterized protein LOC141855710 [Brevipalpus obovatus]|uniref:uncharacterized protein LOC141855710 n=1 Tax=Brevipalpus obovatus TaxID=246614 RepID=UPI003D9F6B32
MDTHKPREKNENVVLQIENASFFYQESGIRSWVLQNVNLTTRASEICAIVGPSGCGKTTLIKLAISLLPLSDGTVKLFGRDAGDPSVGIPGPNVGYMPQEDALPSDLRVRDSLYFFGLLNNMSIGEIRKRMGEVLEQVDLIENSGKFIFQLSGGMKRRLSLAIALLHSPQLLILDEPTVGCDPVLRSRIWKVLRQISSENRTSIVITTHYIEECRFADTINFMRDKTFAVQSRPNQILSIAGTSNLDEAFLRICFHREQSQSSSTDDKYRKLLDVKTNHRHEHQGSPIAEHDYEPIKVSKLSAFSQLRIIFVLILRYLHAFAFDFAAVQLVIFMPTMISLLVHFCLTPRVLGVPVAIIIENQTMYRDQALFDWLAIKPKCFECLHPRHFDEYINHEVIQTIPYDNLDKAMNDLKATKIAGVLYIGDQFSEHYISRVTIHWTELPEGAARNTKMQFYADASKSYVFRALESYLLDAYRKYWEASKINLGMKNGSLFPFEFEDPVIGQKKEELNIKSYFTDTGVFVCNGFCAGFLIGGLLMLSELRDKTMKRCLSTGLKTYHLFAAQTITNGMLIGTSLVGTMGMVIYLLELPLQISAIPAAMLVILQVLTAVILGQLVAAALLSEIAILIIGVSTSYPILALVGSAFAIEAQPYYIQTFSHFLPLTIPTMGIRSALLRGFSFTKLLIIQSFAVSLFYLLLFSLITLSILHKRVHN